MKHEFWAQFDLYSRLNNEWQNKDLIDALVERNTSGLPDKWENLDKFSRIQILAEVLASTRKVKWRDTRGRIREVSAKDYARTGALQYNEESGLLYWYRRGNYQDFLSQRLRWMSSIFSLTNYHDTLSPSLPDLSSFPPGSWAVRVTFTLKKPYISKDDTDFYILDNPVKKEWVFKVPYVAPSQWKGALRAAMVRQLVEWWEGLNDGDRDPEAFARRRFRLFILFGDEKGEEPGSVKGLAAYLDRAGGREAAEHFRRIIREHFRVPENKPIPHFSGRLHFYPTFFDRIGLEVINPHPRDTGAGKNPIYFECVPAGAPGVFILLYVPLDAATEEEAQKDLEDVIRGIRAMLTEYGFGAKTSSGYGVGEIGVISQYESGGAKYQFEKPQIFLETVSKKQFGRFRVKDWKKLLDDQSSNIKLEIKNSWSGIDLNKPEPEIVKEFLTARKPNNSKGIAKLNDIAIDLSKNNFIVKFASVFTHQTPKVNPDGIDGTCEIGDWLIILLLMKGKIPQYISAYMYQAKKIYSAKSMPVINNNCQRTLYDASNGFVYQSPKAIFQKSLCLKIPERCWGFHDDQIRGNALKYLFIDTKNHAFLTYEAPSKAKKQSDFATDLFELMRLNTGLPIKLCPSINDCYWDAIIYDLLNITAQSSLPGYKKKFKRGIGIEETLRAFIDRFNSFEDKEDCFVPPPEKFLGATEKKRRRLWNSHFIYFCSR